MTPDNPPKARSFREGFVGERCVAVVEIPDDDLVVPVATSTPERIELVVAALQRWADTDPHGLELAAWETLRTDLIGTSSKEIEENGN